MGRSERRVVYSREERLEFRTLEVGSARGGEDGGVRGDDFMARRVEERPVAGEIHCGVHGSWLSVHSLYVLRTISGLKSQTDESYRTSIKNARRLQK